MADPKSNPSITEGEHNAPKSKPSDVSSDAPSQGTDEGASPAGVGPVVKEADPEQQPT